MIYLELFLRFLLVFMAHTIFPSHEDFRTLPLTYQAPIGLGMGLADALISTPPTYFKNYFQARQNALLQNLLAPKISLNPRVWFTGTGANCGALLVVAQMQNLIYEAINKKNISPWISAPISGAFSALGATPGDILLRALHAEITEQKKANVMVTTRRLYNTYGLRYFTRGLWLTVIRDAGFTTGYLVAIPTCRNFITHTYGSDGLYAKTIEWTAIVATGIATTVITQPFDTMAGVMQNQPEQKKLNSRLVARRIYLNQGISGFFIGIVPRTSVVTLSLIALDQAKTNLTDLLLQKLKK